MQLIVHVVYKNQCHIPCITEEVIVPALMIGRSDLTPFSTDMLVDRDSATCEPVLPVTTSNDLVVRAKLAGQHNFITVELIVMTPDPSVLSMIPSTIQMYTNIGSLHDDLFSGFFEYCSYHDNRRTGHTDWAIVNFYCDCPTSLCQYVYIKVLRDQVTPLELCEVHVYPDEHYELLSDLK